MKACIYKNGIFEEKELPNPTERDLQPREILVRVKAISFNPIEYKVISTLQPDEERIMGSDGSGIVEAVGDGVELFAIGDEVFYSSNYQQAGSHSTYQIIDERVVAKKPKALSHQEAASLPLTAITAWELLFDRMRLETNHKDKEKILFINGGWRCREHRHTVGIDSRIRGHCHSVATSFDRVV